jgi:hypothetical protein
LRHPSFVAARRIKDIHRAIEVVHNVAVMIPVGAARTRRRG